MIHWFIVIFIYIMYLFFGLSSKDAIVILLLVIVLQLEDTKKEIKK